MGFIDFPALKKLVSLQQVLQLIRYHSDRKQGQYSYGPCPLSCSFRPRSATFDMENNCWYCRACSIGGNHIDLYRLKKGITLYEAAIEICDGLKISVPYYR